MLNVTVKKMWQGKYVSIREPQLKKAIFAGGLVINYDDQHMILNKAELQSLSANLREFKSKYGNKPYRLVDITWKTTDTDLNQFNLI